MTNDFSKIYWEKIYSSEIIHYPDYDGWLDKYFNDLQNANKIVDLGCGNGVNTLYLHEKNINVIACDFSECALCQLKERLSDTIVMHFDMTKGIPIDDTSIDIVIADLSIHYFSWNTTKYLVSEIFRILNENGLLLCRINSIKEYQANDNDEMIEENYYFNGENYKRFFTKNDIKLLFSNYDIYYISEGITNKYGKIKHLWEVAVKAK